MPLPFLEQPLVLDLLANFLLLESALTLIRETALLLGIPGQLGLLLPGKLTWPVPKDVAGQPAQGSTAQDRDQVVVVAGDRPAKCGTTESTGCRADTRRAEATRAAWTASASTKPGHQEQRAGSARFRFELSIFSHLSGLFAGCALGSHAPPGTMSHSAAGIST